MEKLKHIFAILWLISVLGFLWTSTFQNETLMWIFLASMWGFLIAGYLVPTKTINQYNKPNRKLYNKPDRKRNNDFNNFKYKL